jgi:hypothetical protein
VATIFENFYRALSRLKPGRAARQDGSSTLDVAASLQEIKRILVEIDGKELEHSEPLHPRDLQLIGELIQIYNYIEFNLRRCIELFTHAGMIAKSDKTIPIARLSSVAMEGISKAEDGEAWAAHLTEIELHRDARNQLAHWAARHILGESALLILSMNPAESKKRIKQPTDHEHSTYGVMLVKDLQWLVQHIARYEKMLAEATSSWHQRYVPTTENL